MPRDTALRATSLQSGRRTNTVSALKWGSSLRRLPNRWHVDTNHIHQTGIGAGQSLGPFLHFDLYYTDGLALLDLTGHTSTLMAGNKSAALVTKPLSKEWSLSTKGPVDARGHRRGAVVDQLHLFRGNDPDATRTGTVTAIQGFEGSHHTTAILLAIDTRT